VALLAASFYTFFMFKTRRYTQIFVPAPANTPALTNLAIPQQSLLQDVTGKEPVYIRRIDAFCSTTLSGVIGQPGLAIAAEADLTNGILSLVVGATLDYKWVPLTRLNPYRPDPNNYAGGPTDPFFLANMCTIDWTQSFITTIIAAPTTTAFGYVLGIDYLYEKDLLEMQAKGFDWVDV
jgi:hypothetical protein